MSGPERVVGTAPTAADLASLAQLYAADLARFRATSELDIDAWPTVRILSGRLSAAELAERFAARVEARPDPAPAHAKGGAQTLAPLARRVRRA